MNMHLLHHTYITSNTNVSNSGRQNKQLESTSQKALIAQVCHNCTIDCTMPWPWSILRLFSPLCVSAMPNSTSHTDYQQQSSLLITAQSRTIILASVIPQEQLRWKIPPNVQRWLAKIFNNVDVGKGFQSGKIIVLIAYCLKVVSYLQYELRNVTANIDLIIVKKSARPTSASPPTAWAPTPTSPATPAGPKNKGVTCRQ